MTTIGRCAPRPVNSSTPVKSRSSASSRTESWYSLAWRCTSLHARSSTFWMPSAMPSSAGLAFWSRVAPCMSAYSCSVYRCEWLAQEKATDCTSCTSL